MPKERKPAVLSQELNLREFLAGEGYTTPWAQHQARAVLEAAGLTKPGRTAMLSTKRAAAQEQLAKWLVRTCGTDECMAWAKEQSDGRLVLAASELTCEVCGGSNNRRAAMAMLRACAAKGVTRLLIVGGVGATRGEVESLLAGTKLELRMIDGASGRHTRGDAAPNLAWAQLLVIWGSSPLPHAVSNTYTVERPRELKAITVSRRGVEALCREIIRAVGAL